jgi:drug/metabolite transporter (DMT)-like permease
VSSGPGAARHRSTLVLCLAIVYVVWGSSFLATRIAVHELPPFLMGGLRFMAGGALLWAFARATGRATGRLDASELRRIGWVGLGCVLVSNGCNAWALQWISSSESALLNASSAFWIALLGTFGQRAHPITLRVGLGLAIGFAGTALLMSPGPGAAADAAIAAATGGPGVAAQLRLPPAVPPPSPHGPLVPSIVVLLGCLGWAFGTIYMRNQRTGLDMLSFTGLQMFAGGVMLVALAALAGEFGRWQWSPAGLAAMAWLMVFSSCVAYTAYAWLSQHATPAQVGSYAFVNPALATLLGWAVLGERLSPLQWSGMIVVLGSLAIIHVSHSPRGTAPPD